jgi:hypothetical protein
VETKEGEFAEFMSFYNIPIGDEAPRHLFSGCISYYKILMNSLKVHLKSIKGTKHNIYDCYYITFVPVIASITNKKGEILPVLGFF